LTDSSKYLYLLSAVAQSLAAILALVFTITLVVAQLRTRYGMHLATHAIRWRQFWKLGVFVVGTLFPLVALHWGGPLMAWISIGLAAVCMSVLVLHLRDMRNELKIDPVIREWRTDALKALTANDSKRADEVTQQLEEIGYGALEESDFATLRLAASSLAMLAVHSSGRTPRLDAKLLSLCAQATSSPRGAVTAFEGAIEGLDTGEQSLALCSSLATDLLEATITNCEWPRQEPICADCLYAFRNIFGALARQGDDPSSFNKIVGRISALLPRKMGFSGNPGDVLNYGAGQAAYRLAISYCAGAREGNRLGDRKRFVSACVKAALTIRPARLPGIMGRFEPEIVRNNTAILAECAHALIESEIAGALESFDTKKDPSPSLAASEWLEMATAFAATDSAKLVSIALGQFGHFLSQDELAEKQSRSLLGTFTARLGELLKSHQQVGINKYVSPFETVQHRWGVLRIEGNVIARLMWRAAAISVRPKGNHELLIRLQALLHSMAGAALVDNRVAGEETGDIALCSLLATALCHVYGDRVNPSHWPAKEQILRQYRNEAEKLKAYYKPRVADAVEMAKKESPDYAEEMERFMTRL